MREISFLFISKTSFFFFFCNYTLAEEAQICGAAFVLFFFFFFIMWHNSPLTPEVSAASRLSQSHAQLLVNHLSVGMNLHYREPRIFSHTCFVSPLLFFWLVPSDSKSCHNERELLN